MKLTLGVMPQRRAGECACGRSLIDRGFAIHEDVSNAGRVSARVLECSLVEKIVRRENHDVGVIAWSQKAAVGQAKS